MAGETSNGARRRSAVSAGGVVYRHEGGRVEVVLCVRRRDQLWALPKGTPEPDETTEETALREVREETGLHVEIVDRVGDVRYRFFDARGGVEVDKVVHHFLMQPVGGDLDQHDHEFDEARWYDIHEAGRLLTHQNQVPILERASALIAKMTP
jgi:8-oxo-dGTP pyrophosphatase MutT (NUDIX family)